MKRIKLVRILFVLILLPALVSGAAGFGAHVFATDDGGNSGEAETVVPSYIFDFTDDSTYDIGYSGQCMSEITDDGLLCTASDDDPNVSIGTPLVSGSEMGWIVIKYRGKLNHKQRYGELYFTTQGSGMSERNKVMWALENVSDEWVTLVVRARALGKTEDTIMDVRYDPMASGGGTIKVEAGEMLETAFIAFFPTEEAANQFDYDKYKAENEEKEHSSHEQGSEEKWAVPPAYNDVTLKSDNAGGTLKIDRAGAGEGYVKISYTAGEKEYSYELPDNAFILNGPLAGIDDAGRSQPDQFTVIDPDYVARDVEGEPAEIDNETRTIGVFGENGRRYVGIFYFIWLGTENDANDTPRNISAIIGQYGTAAKDMPELWAQTYKTFFFAEPLYGYYRSKDEWVIRKHMELLSNAGIDFLYFDVTNLYLYESNAIKVMKVCHELNEQGFAAPKVVFYTHTNAKERVKQAYKNIYEPELYPDTWLMLDGKPLIIAPATANIDGFFTIREPQWPNEDKETNTWPWIDWQWPQDLYGANDMEAISVSVAQHSGNCEFSSSTLYGYTGNRGRSYNGYTDDHTADSYKLGTNLQLQFNRAITSGVPYVLVTGWNEWIASRQEPAKKERPIRFVDTFDYEYSRDIEMSRGGYFDNYYMQLASNVSAIRGSAPVILRDDRHQINVTGNMAQWDAVSHYYSDPSGDAEERNELGHGGEIYVNSTGRNDIVRVKVTGDSTYLYFMVECAENIVHGSGNDSWMQIFIDAGDNEENWYGYEYIVNYSTKNDYTSTLAKYSGNGGAYGFTEVADLTYKVSGKKMMVAVPLEALGVEFYDMIDLKFKVCDSRSAVNTMEQFYEDGDAAPLGRMNFTYQTYIDPELSGSRITVHDTVKVADRAQRAQDEQNGFVDEGRTIPGGGEGNASEGQGKAFLKALPWIAGAAVVAGAAVAAVAAIRRRKAKNNTNDIAKG
ncbi:MAG: hypothetical protein J5950_10805 [Clostridia bacterium]|nr:hypothetical protein [Clostridia bacterium]